MLIRVWSQVLSQPIQDGCSIRRARIRRLFNLMLEEDPYSFTRCLVGLCDSAVGGECAIRDYVRDLIREHNFE